ncbi:MAG: two-component system response regulator [bacterium]|nr:MAG: two-component system response regulator [bacterium]
MEKPFKDIKVLVVDDYENMRTRLASWLKQFGMDVVEAENGLEAMTVLRDEKHGKFDIVFTDIVMPEMDGYELCEEIRKTPAMREMPIVVTSTHADSNYVIKALRMGADDYIAKPVDVDVLEKVITRVMTPISIE